MNRKALLGTVLLGQHLITAGQLEECLKLQSVRQEKLGSLLVEKEYLRPRDLARSLTIQKNFPFVPIDFSLINQETIFLIGFNHARNYNCLPLQRHDHSLTVAMSDPLNLSAIQDLQFQCGLEIKPVFALKDEILAAIRFFYKGEDLSPQPYTGHQEKVDHIEYGDDYLEEDGDSGMTEMSEINLVPVIRMQNMIIEEAIRVRASDIHIEPKNKFVQIRNRVDGWLTETIRVPKWMQESLLARLKILANMDISEKRLPQDASFRVRKNQNFIDIRVSTLPTKHGEKMVLRLLDKSRGLLSLKDLGLSSKQKTIVKSLIEKPQGLILVVGPTGSGKTTTLYAVINSLRSETLNIVTIEDPIEYELEKINQVQIQEKTGLTFSAALRSILRQDPDVILVGEIRDLETANITFRAAFTGHLVFSTLHTNDTASTITRLCDIGIEPYIISSSLLAVISQRLIRKNCPHCLEPYHPSEEVLAKFPQAGKSGVRFFRGRGCSHCNYQGYLGREGFYEIMTISAKVREAITQKAPEQTLRKLAMEQGMLPLIDEGFRKARKGLVNLEEITRVIAATQESLTICSGCGEFLDPEFLVCPSCETPFRQRCPSCGRALQTGWNICPFCGKGKPRIKSDQPQVEFSH
jgi:type IV pilus assembly protein PilB